jgi:hypothetical protein
VTNREGQDLGAVIELIDLYRARWEVEIFLNTTLNQMVRICAARIYSRRRIIFRRIARFHISRFMHLAAAAFPISVTALAFHRLKMYRKCSDLDAAQLF